jgi:hypothetical protein
MELDKTAPLRAASSLRLTEHYYNGINRECEKYGTCDTYGTAENYIEVIGWHTSWEATDSKTQA